MNKPVIIGLGEAIYDVFPDHECLGGAPLNFAVHANRFAGMLGKAAAPLSCIGMDERGERMRAELEGLDVFTDWLQVDAEHPTGFVTVELTGGEPQYKVAPNVAWDYFEYTPDLEPVAQEAEAIYFGTLAQRHDSAREAIETFLTRAPKALKIFDLNLRQDFYDYSMLRRSCALANVIKLNRHELEVLTEMLSIPGANEDEQIKAMFNRFPIEMVLLTRGRMGTVVYRPSGHIEVAPAHYEPVDGADTVGSGDAAAAAAVCALLAGMPPEKIAELANHAGAYVASQPGATPRLPDAIVSMLDRRVAGSR